MDKGPQVLRTGRSAARLVAPTTLEASLLRCITAQTLLQQCAVAFQSQECVEEHYSKSFETEWVGDFISHDWASGRLGKLVALGLVYNSRAAMTASTVVSVAMAFLQYGSDPILPPPRIAEFDEHIAEDDRQANLAQHYGFWNTLIAPLVFVFFFLFWQDLRALLMLRSRTCFLDKYCIDQTNPKRKAAGILGLAGFLRCSDRIIILWTPRYFTRLWCTYEVASWLHLEKPMASVLFMPLVHVSIIIMVWVLESGLFLLLALLMPLFPRYYLHMLVGFVTLGVILVCHGMRRSAVHLRALKDQLMSFAVSNSKCFCCASGHLTATGEVIPCDRQVVYATIAEWFNNPKGDGSVTTTYDLLPAEAGLQEACLDRFDQAVRTKFAAKVLQKVGPTQFPFSYLVVAGWPYVLRGHDLVPAAHAHGPTVALNALMMYFTLAFAVMPLWYKFTSSLCCWLDLRVGEPHSWVVDLSVSAAATVASVAAALAMYAPMEFVLTRNLSPLVMLSMVTVMLAMTFWVYSDFKEGFSDFKEGCVCKRRCCRTAQSRSKRCKKSTVEENEEMEEKECPHELEYPHESDADVLSILSI